MRLRLASVLLAAVLVFFGCSARRRARAAGPDIRNTAEVGIASWYGHPYHGRPAANGETYDMERLTAAHRTLPFETVVRVENLSNGKKVDVRITDRGPFVEGRIIDLSRAAARTIDMIGPGTTMVRLHILSPAARPPGREMFAVQVGAFRERANADRLRGEMERRFGAARVVARAGDPTIWRVIVGGKDTPEAAVAFAEKLRGELGAAFVVRVDDPVL